MNLKVVLIASAIYLGLIGIGVLFVPRYFGIGAIPPEAPPALIAFSPDLRRPLSRDCRSELDGAQCGAVPGA
jgi:hypothetical protein